MSSLEDLKKENENLKHEQIINMITRTHDLVKYENEKIHAKLENVLLTHNELKEKHDNIERTVIPDMQKCLEKHQHNYVLVSKDIENLYKTQTKLETETQIPRDMAKYPKVIWLLLLLLSSFGSGISIFKFLLSFFK